MILADTSVLIVHYRKPDPVRTRWIAATSAAVCGATVAEMYAGARKAAQLAGTAAMLSLFGSVPTPEYVWELTGLNRATLLANGLNIAIPDVLIATVSIDAGIELWTYDSHFALMAGLLPGLTLYREPP